MQKIFRILLIIFLFVVCLLIGANLANITLPETTQTTNAQLTDESQNQILVFVVDDFENRKPQLQSLWSVFLYWHDSSGIMFMPLSDQLDPNFDEYKKSFLLTPERTLNDRSMRFFNTKFKTKWNSYVVMDKMSLQLLISWSTGGSILELPEFRQETISTIQNLCAIIPGNFPSIESFDWASIQPSHFVSNLSFEQMKTNWDNLRNSEFFLCEIIQE